MHSQFPLKLCLKSKARYNHHKCPLQIINSYPKLYDLSIQTSTHTKKCTFPGRRQPPRANSHPIIMPSEMRVYDDGTGASADMPLQRPNQPNGFLMPGTSGGPSTQNRLLKLPTQQNLPLGQQPHGQNQDSEKLMDSTVTYVMPPDAGAGQAREYYTQLNQVGWCGLVV